MTTTKKAAAPRKPRPKKPKEPEAVAASVSEPTPAPTPPAPEQGPNAATAIGDAEAVKLQLGHMQSDTEGTMAFHKKSEFHLGLDAARKLIEELHLAIAEHLNSGHVG